MFYNYTSLNNYLRERERNLERFNTDLNDQINGIKNVSCYLLFVDLESNDSKNQLNLIIQYFLKNCNLSKKMVKLT